MRNPTRSLLTALVLTTVVVTGALGWAGWRLLDQERALAQQRSRDQAENLADAIAGRIRGKLAEAGERLSGWVSSPTPGGPTIEGAVVVGIGADSIFINPSGALPFAPVVIRAPAHAATFGALETLEFAGAPERALAGYQRLANDRDAEIRAGALLRLGRVQRKTRDFAGALVTYQRLAQLGAARAEDLPAELAGLNGQRSAYLAMADHQQADEIGRRILRGLDGGRWLISRGAAELYREPFTEPRPESWSLANALSELWRETDGRLPSRGQRVVGSPDGTPASVLVLWRSNGAFSAALAASADRFFDPPAVPSAPRPSGSMSCGCG